ncbi:two-component system phosphate regulon sensor histidine kinase PhoR [Geothermobacter ehrlichii]|uniref:histidine kinase n=1 Tax=Geothermobacter ehrlichii TaxID=213224 RepID=A0A5D3WIQ6_9BACT|nr:ATP-binding protein [Geothermobacter ehrlichii]TYO98122.1 two-component system phosphate regulon sensor histidine kinase PhoR [Geothermobacter ehrlichii]
MAARRLLWTLFPAFLLVILLSLAGGTWYASRVLRRFHLEQTAATLLARARLVDYQLAGRIDRIERLWIDHLCKELGRRSGSRVTVVLADGTVLGDSDEDPGRMDNHGTRPEILSALSGRVGRSMRFSHTIGQTMLYVAIPVARQEKIVGVVRVAVPMTAVNETLAGMRWQILTGGLVVALLAALISLQVARRLSRPLEVMKAAAHSFADGDLSRRIPGQGTVEMQTLAESMNRMAEQLDGRIRMVLEQRNEIEAVLASMVEGVLAVDAEERLLRINRAAIDMLGLSGTGFAGRPLEEVIRRVDLQRFVRRALESERPVEADLVVRGHEDRYLQAHGTRLAGADRKRQGAVVVLNDVTRLRRLERVRRDFVANVSHELKTPITAIKGFVETLESGGVDDPHEVRRFLGIIHRQADRLNAIIDDLLQLSRLEQESGGQRIELAAVAVAPVVRAAVQDCEMQALRAKVKVHCELVENLVARVNPQLLEQAVSNLVDNAVKYSPAGSEVRVRAFGTEDGICIEVADRGCGIAAEHLPRLFERFYRVDKARSRKLGGTGLGLAIVKHIAQVHGGRVGVESAPGEGSRFWIWLPATDATGGRA